MLFPLVAGPYTGEMAFEFLNWIPYLRLRFGEDMKGLLAISRGGTEDCYPCDVINAYDVMGVEEFRTGMILRKNATGKYKQLPNDALDNEILRRLGLQSDIHPSRAMAVPWGYLADYVRKFDKPANKPKGLPEKYVALRMFQNEWLDTFPPKEAILEYANGLPIIWFESRDQSDNHTPLIPTLDTYSITYPVFSSISNTIMSFANAEMVLAPAGGASYLGLLCGTKTVAFSNRGNENYYCNVFDEKLQEFASLTRHRF